MRYLLIAIILASFVIPVSAQELKNPSLIIETVEIPSEQFNIVLRDTLIIQLDKIHAVSWQVTIDNNLLYANPLGTAVIRLYDQESDEQFIEIGMGPPSDNKFWVAVQTTKEGYIVVHRDLDRGWYPQAKIIVSYTERAGLTVNNGARIVVTNLDIDKFGIDSYSIHGMEGSTDPPAVSAGEMIVEFLSGDPAKNIFAFFPFYVAAGVGIMVGILYVTKKRS